MKFIAKRALIIGQEVLNPEKEYDSKKLKVADKFIRSWEKDKLVQIIEEKEETVDDEKKKEKYTAESLKEKNVQELKDICKDLGIRGYSKLTEDELIEKILKEQ
jgi:primosomal protein N'